MAANSWVTVYGTNLAVTTRSWTTDDVLNGGLPFSIDGVSVLLTGAPRLAYVGFVSPTQVNFLLPSDQGNATVQVQVRNPAGISAQMPISVQANAPQMLTLDGKYVLASHAGGTYVAKTGFYPTAPNLTSPAAPGEAITLYGTGLGPTTPALIPGQIPAQGAPILTPTVTIGGDPATVTSASAVAGSAGLYVVNVVVPGGTTNGDQPVVVTLGNVASAITQLTVQR